jgi:hypothetical protein
MIHAEDEHDIAKWSATFALQDAKRLLPFHQPFAARICTDLPKVAVFLFYATKKDR